MITLYIKGMIIGVANIIPGVSGGTLALILGLYYKIINSFISLLKFKDVKKSIIFFSVLLIGVASSIIVLARIFSRYIFDGGEKETLLMIFFIGLIFGSVFSLKKEADNAPLSKKNEKLTKSVLFILGFLIISSLLVLKHINLSFDTINIVPKNSYAYIILLIVSGFLSGSAMILPGISGSALLLVLGSYEEVIRIVSEFEIFSCIIFGSSALLGIGITILLIKKTIENHLSNFIYLSMGLIFGSILQMILIILTLNFSFSLIFTLIGSISFILGLCINIVIEKYK